MLRRMWPPHSTVAKLVPPARYRASSARLTIPKALGPIQVMGQMRLHDCLQDLSSFWQPTLYACDHAFDIGQHACGYAVWVHLGMARQKAGDDGLERDHAAVQVRGWVILGFVSHYFTIGPRPQWGVSRAVPGAASDRAGFVHLQGPAPSTSKADPVLVQALTACH